MGVFVGGYGILPYPRHPLKSSHRIHRIHGSFWQRIFSHGFHRFPQMVRLRYWRRGYGRMPYPPNLCASVSICGRLSLPEGSVCSAYSVGTLSPSALFGSVVVFSHGIHGMLGCVIGGVGMAGMPYPPNLCASVPICGRLSLPECSVCSACSVGHSLCLLCWCICGRHISAGFRPPPNRIASAVQSDCVRHPIRFRPPSDQVPSAARCHK